jgi:hypothetical protein
MIRQAFDVNGYWRVIVFYDMDYALLYDVVRVLADEEFPSWYVRQVFFNMYLGAKAVTCSNTGRKGSIVIFNEHDTMEDYINSIVHEAEHVKQAMLYAYEVEDSGEPPAYTIGYLVMRMYEVFRMLVCPCG